MTVEEQNAGLPPSTIPTIPTETEADAAAAEVPITSSVLRSTLEEIFADKPPAPAAAAAPAVSAEDLKDPVRAARVMQRTEDRMVVAALKKYSDLTQDQAASLAEFMRDQVADVADAGTLLALERDGAGMTVADSWVMNLIQAGSYIPEKAKRMALGQHVPAAAPAKADAGRKGLHPETVRELEMYDRAGKTFTAEQIKRADDWNRERF